MLDIIILAAGKGTRMKSDRAKVLHRLAGRTLIEHVIDKALELHPEKIIVVIGHRGHDVRNHIRHVYDNPKIVFVEQFEQLGTAHAVETCLPVLKGQGNVLILYGDVPLLNTNELYTMIDHPPPVLLTAVVTQPLGYGRIVRSPHQDTQVQQIVEEKALTATQKSITEINTGVIYISQSLLFQLIPLIKKSKAGEYYLTDLIEQAFSQHPFQAQRVQHPKLFVGVNDAAQLACSERIYQQQCANHLMAQGVHMMHPDRFDQRGTVTVGQDVEIDVGVILLGNIQLGNRVKIAAYCVLEDVMIGDDSIIEPFCHVSQAHIGQHVKIGPYARIRPGSHIGNASHIGNFVEVKNSSIAEGTKANHLAYIGDADVGKQVNIGAGTITCNYDGATKHRTIIEDEVFIGSDCQLVAPITVKKGATLGAGTTLTRDAPAEQLTLSRVKQKTIMNWQRPKKK